MTILMNDATNANVAILQRTNELFQLTQKRVATGKNVFGAADDATRYKMSETMLGRGRQLSDVNNNVSLGLSTLDATDKTLKNMVGLIESAQTLIRRAQAGSSWTTDQNIQTSATQANQALINLRDFQAQFATFDSYIKSRYDLNKAYEGDLSTQGDELVASDTSEESANLIALQTRQQFAVQALTIGNQNEQSLLKFLS